MLQNPQLHNVFPLNKKSKKSNADKINFTLKSIQPLTSNQKFAFREYDKDCNMFFHGYAGTGKTFLLLYLALNQILNENSPYKKIVLVRSAVPTRDIGYLPGNSKEKAKVYEAAYYAILSELFGRGDSYDYLKNKGIVEFMTTSYIRALTLNDSIIIVDETQNYSFHELDSCITRVGENSKILFAGDFRQSDLTKEKSGIQEFIKIIKSMNSFSFIEFGQNDIVRSELVKEYIIAKEKMNGQKVFFTQSS